MLNGKRILIVGGSSGIGLAIARLAVKEGAEVTIASRSVLKRKDEIRSIIGDVNTLYVDITSETEIEQMFEKTGNIDHLVITAKSEVKICPFQDADLDDVKKAFETKFWGQYRLIKRAVHRINPEGSITLSSGITSQRPHPGLSTMSLINGATESFCRALAIELAPIRVNVVSPGFVTTDNKNIQAMARDFPLKSLASPEVVARVYLFFMQQTYCTASVIVVDGGASQV